MADIPQERLNDLIHRANNNGYSALDTKRQIRNNLDTPEVATGVILTPHELKVLLDVYKGEVNERP